MEDITDPEVAVRFILKELEKYDDRQLICYRAPCFPPLTPEQKEKWEKAQQIIKDGAIYPSTQAADESESP